MTSLVYRREEQEGQCLGLPPRGFNAFELHAPIEGRVAAIKPPQKRGPKISRQDRALLDISSPEERKAIREALVLKQKTQALHIGRTTQDDKAKRSRLIGRNHPGSV